MMQVFFSFEETWTDAAAAFVFYYSNLCLLTLMAAVRYFENDDFCTHEIWVETSGQMRFLLCNGRCSMNFLILTFLYRFLTSFLFQWFHFFTFFCKNCLNLCSKCSTFVTEPTVCCLAQISLFGIVGQVIQKNFFFDLCIMAFPVRL